MSPTWSFTTDAKSDDYCREVAAEMVRLFGISGEEAVGRINRHWKGLSFLGDRIDDHESADYWAHLIYHGNDSYWWVKGEKREQMGLGPIVPQPYP